MNQYTWIVNHPMQGRVPVVVIADILDTARDMTTERLFRAMFWGMQLVIPDPLDMCQTAEPDYVVSLMKPSAEA